MYVCMCVFLCGSTFIFTVSFFLWEFNLLNKNRCRTCLWTKIRKVPKELLVKVCFLPTPVVLIPSSFPQSQRCCPVSSWTYQTWSELKSFVFDVFFCAGGSMPYDSYGTVSDHYFEWLHVGPFLRKSIHVSNPFLLMHISVVSSVLLL